jgi:hypothetical protein
MELQAREQIKSLLAQRGKTMKELAQELSLRLNKTYLPDSLSHKLRRGSISYNEMLIIFDILGYKLIFKDKNS